MLDESRTIIDSSGIVRWANENFIKIVEGEREFVLGAHVSIFFPGFEQQILGEYDAKPENNNLIVHLMPLTTHRVLPVKVRTVGLQGTDGKILILQQDTPLSYA